MLKLNVIPAKAGIFRLVVMVYEIPIFMGMTEQNTGNDGINNKEKIYS